MPSRILREGILTSERVDSLSHHGELFYRRLMSVVDDFGRFDGRPQMLRVSCFPLRVDRVREADISRWLDELQTAGLIVLYAVNGKPYLEMHDFRQQIRAKESRYPPPDLIGGCKADAKQVLSGCGADEHVDGGVDEDVDEDGKPPPPRARDSVSDGPFRMHSDWKPSEHFASLTRQAGLPIPGEEDFAVALSEFVAYWLTQNRTRTQHEWDHALVKSLKADKLRGDVPKQQQKQGKPGKFDPVAYVNRNRTSGKGNSNASDGQTVIDGTAERLA